MNQLIENKKEDLKDICKEMKVQSLYAFGSVVTERFGDLSDLDFLISFPENLSIEEYLKLKRTDPKS